MLDVVVVMLLSIYYLHSTWSSAERGVGVFGTG